MRFLSQAIREPILHFLLIGAALFFLYAAVGETQDDTTARFDVTVSEAEVAQLAARYQEMWRRPPNVEEVQGLIRAYVREDVLVQEALALSMDVGDPIIRRRLAQKMEFLIDSAAASLVPTEVELRQHYDDNIDRYNAGGRVAFEQIFLGQNPSGDEVNNVLSTLEGGTPPDEVGQRTLLPPEVSLSGRQAVQNVFGRGFFDGVMDLPGSGWQGPVQSGFGQHLVRVTDKQDAAPVGFDAARAQVEVDWRTEAASDLAESVYQEMRQRYAISIPAEDQIADWLQ